MSTILKSKTRIFGERLNTLELLEALKSPLFSDRKVPLLIFTRSHAGLLKIVYLFKGSETLYFATGNFDDHIKADPQHLMTVCIDHTQDDRYVSIQEIITLLEKVLKKTRFISLQHAADDYTYGLTIISKCDTCESVHLDCTYDKDCVLPN